MQQKDIFEFIKAEESAYQTIPVPVADGYEWSMAEHIRTTVLYKNSKYLTGFDDDRPFKNIIRPILNLAYRAEGFDVKDINLFVNDTEEYYKSFLVDKFHEKWARQQKIDTFIDELVESYVDFGGVLVKDVNKVKPEVVQLQSIDFCDQTDIQSGPIGLNHFYSPDQLLDMAKVGWGNTKNGATASLEDVISIAGTSKDSTTKDGKKTKTPGKYIRVVEVHGMFPNSWLALEPTEKDETTYSLQIHIVTFLTLQDGEKQGITLFRGKEKESIFKFLSRDPIYGRALGMGGAEELFEAQVWLNDDMINMKGLKEQAAKIIYQTTDATFANRNKTNDLDNGEILITALDTSIQQINTQPVNITVFENSVEQWEAHAQQTGAANDSIMGETPNSGTPFKLQELVTQEAHSLHEYRQGQIATFVDEIYKDWVIPYIVREITKGQEFLTTLSLDELQQVSDNLVTAESNKMIKEKILNGEEIQDADKQAYEQRVRQQFMKGGSKRFIKILAGELKDAPVDVEVNIAGKEKDLSGMTDKLTNIFRMLMANPALLNDPRMAKLFNQILEASGISPIDFSQAPTQPQSSPPAPKVALSINYKDLPPEGKPQAAAEAGIKIAAAPQQTNPPAMAQLTQ